MKARELKAVFVALGAMAVLWAGSRGHAPAIGGGVCVQPPSPIWSPTMSFSDDDLPWPLCPRDWSYSAKLPPLPSVFDVDNVAFRSAFLPAASLAIQAVTVAATTAAATTCPSSSFFHPDIDGSISSLPPLTSPLFISDHITGFVGQSTEPPTTEAAKVSILWRRILRRLPETIYMAGPLGHVQPGVKTFIARSTAINDSHIITYAIVGQKKNNIKMSNTLSDNMKTGGACSIDCDSAALNAEPHHDDPASAVDASAASSTTTAGATYHHTAASPGEPLFKQIDASSIDEAKAAGSSASHACNGIALFPAFELFGVSGLCSTFIHHIGRAFLPTSLFDGPSNTTDVYRQFSDFLSLAAYLLLGTCIAVVLLAFQFVNGPTTSRVPSSRFVLSRFDKRGRPSFGAIPKRWAWAFLLALPLQLASSTETTSMTSWLKNTISGRPGVEKRDDTENQSQIGALTKKLPVEDSFASVPIPDVRGLRLGGYSKRDSALSVADMSTFNSNDIAAQLELITKSQYSIDQGLNELNLLFGGDSSALSSLAENIGIAEQDAYQVLQYMNMQIGLDEDIKALASVLQDEIKPMLSNVFESITTKDGEIGRHLSDIFGPRTTVEEDKYHAKAGHFDGSSDTQRPHSTNAARPHENEDHSFTQNHSQRDSSSFFHDEKGSHSFRFESILKDSNNVDKYVRRLVEQTGMKMPGMESFSGFGNHHHRSHIRPKGRTKMGRWRRHKRRLQEIGLTAELDTCDVGCIQTDSSARKACNCEDLIYCVNQLKDNDYAVLFSKGLVDKETGTIEVEKEILDNTKLWAAGEEGGNLFDEDFELRKEANSAVDDTFDAKQLLVKMNRIRGLALTGQENCDALLDEFHVPCKDWRDGCSDSDGRSYRLTIDEICDSVDSPELVTFASMSEAFDDETTEEASCLKDEEDGFPKKEVVLLAAKNAVRALMPPGGDQMSDYMLNTDGVQPISTNLDWWKSLGNALVSREKEINDAYIIRCLNDVEECCPFTEVADDNRFRGDFCGTLEYNNPNNFATPEFVYAQQIEPSRTRGTPFDANRAIDGNINTYSDTADGGYVFMHVKARNYLWKVRRVVIYKSKNTGSASLLFRMWTRSRVDPSDPPLVIGALYETFQKRFPNPNMFKYNITVSKGAVPYATFDGFTLETTDGRLQIGDVEIYITDIVQLPTKQLYQDAILAAMRNSVGSAKSGIESCFSRECGLDTKVGLKSCQNMIDCADQIWRAGNAAAIILPELPNPYPFTLAKKQELSDISGVKNAEWNTDLAIGKTVWASSTADGSDPFYLVDGKDNTAWESSSNDTTASLFIDLRRSFALGRVELSWKEDKFATSYSIELSDDTENWENALTSTIESIPTGALTTVAEISGSARYVRLTFSDPTNNNVAVTSIQIFADPTDPTSETSKWNSLEWPKNWALAQDRHGLVTFPDPMDNALVHEEFNSSSTEIATIPYTQEFKTGDVAYVFEHLIEIYKPRVCGLNVREDTRCDRTRTLLFGESTSVGQICSLAAAVKEDPQNMPGTCCLDGIDSFENFGERYSCKKKCSRLAPYTLGMSEDACDQVGGTWCRRPCSKLKQCIENKPVRGKCRVAANYNITGDGFVLANSGNDCEIAEDAIYLDVSCKDESGNDCRLPRVASSNSSVSRRELTGSFVSLKHNESILSNLTSSEIRTSSFGIINETLSQGNGGDELQTITGPYCEERNLTFSFIISFESSSEDSRNKVFTKLISGRNSRQTDLYEKLGNNTEFVFGSSPLTITFDDSITLCSDDKSWTNLVVLELQNEDYNEAFDEFSGDLSIEDASDEQQCQQVREFLGFEPNYIDDNEICRAFYDIKCDFNKEGVTEIDRIVTTKPRGGIIPNFKGFEFKPESFDGFEFEASEFVGFEFEGFDPSSDFSFSEVRQSPFVEAEEFRFSESEINKMKNAILALEKAYDYFETNMDKIKVSKCPIPFVVVLGAGTDAPCTVFDAIASAILVTMLAIALGMYSVLKATIAIYDKQVQFDDRDSHEHKFLSEAMHSNLNTLNTALYSNLNIINTNINKQHTEVRSTLENQHSTMMDLLSSQHTEIGTQLTEQHNSIGNQLTEQHTSIGTQLTEQHNSVGKQLTDQHTSIGEQLTNQHKILRENILALAEALGGNLDGFVRRRLTDESDRLEWEGDTPYNLLTNISAAVEKISFQIFSSDFGRPCNPDLVNITTPIPQGIDINNSTSIEELLTNSDAGLSPIKDAIDASSVRLSNVTGVVSDILDILKNDDSGFRSLKSLLSKVISDLGVIKSHLKIGEDGLEGMEESISSASVASEVEGNLNGNVDAARSEIATATIELQSNIDSAKIALRSEINASKIEVIEMVKRSARTTRRLVKRLVKRRQRQKSPQQRKLKIENPIGGDDHAVSTKASSLEATIHCVSSPRQKMVEGTSSDGALHFDFLVSTASNNKIQDAEITDVSGVSFESGEYMNHNGKIRSTKSLRTGLKHVRVHFDRHNEYLRNAGDILSLYFVIEKEGSEKAVVFDLASCKE